MGTKGRAISWSISGSSVTTNDDDLKRPARMPHSKRWWNDATNATTNDAITNDAAADDVVANDAAANDAAADDATSDDDDVAASDDAALDSLGGLVFWKARA